MAKFEGQERRAAKIAACLETLGMKEIEEARDLCLSKRSCSCNRRRLTGFLHPWFRC